MPFKSPPQYSPHLVLVESKRSFLQKTGITGAKNKIKKKAKGSWLGRMWGKAKSAVKNVASKAKSAVSGAASWAGGIRRIQFRNLSPLIDGVSHNWEVIPLPLDNSYQLKKLQHVSILYGIPEQEE